MEIRFSVGGVPFSYEEPSEASEGEKQSIADRMVLAAARAGASLTGKLSPPSPARPPGSSRSRRRKIVDPVPTLFDAETLASDPLELPTDDRAADLPSTRGSYLGGRAGRRAAAGEQNGFRFSTEDHAAFLKIVRYDYERRGLRLKILKHLYDHEHASSGELSVVCGETVEEISEFIRGLRRSSNAISNQVCKDREKNGSARKPKGKVNPGRVVLMQFGRNRRESALRRWQLTPRFRAWLRANPALLRTNGGSP